MRHREAVYGFRERYDDLNKAYKKALSEGNFSTQEDAIAVAINMPSRRFWVSEERLVEVINAMESGKDIRVSHRSPRYEMFHELYRRYLEYKAGHPGLSKLEICAAIIYQEAPSQYISLSYAIRLFYRGRNKRQRRHHLRNTERTNNKITNG